MQGGSPKHVPKHKNQIAAVVKTVPKKGNDVAEGISWLADFAGLFSLASEWMSKLALQRDQRE